mmetsp:Transcript_11057/g.10971  ORF Transcript_11057/g.10971 Transcript_11057/m.10971 type:complete len:314 (-) Transcript_11057:956-1897(-)
MSNYIMPAVEKITLEAPEIQKSLNNLILKGKNYTSSFPEWVDQTRTNKITPSEEGSLHMIKDAEVCQIRRKVYSKECQVSSLLNFPSIISLCNSMLIEKPHPKVSLVSWELCRTINKKQKDFAHKITKKAMDHFFSSIQTNFVINDMISSDDKKVLKLMIWQLKFDLSCNRQSLGWEQTLQNGKKYRVRCSNINPKVLKKTIADYIFEIDDIPINGISVLEPLPLRETNATERLGSMNNRIDSILIEDRENDEEEDSLLTQTMNRTQDRLEELRQSQNMINFSKNFTEEVPEYSKDFKQISNGMAEAVDKLDI